jgi:hypothetical protein
VNACYNQAAVKAAIATDSASSAGALAVRGHLVASMAEVSTDTTAAMPASSTATAPAGMAIAGEAHASGTAGEPRLFPGLAFAGDVEVTLRRDTPGAVID